MPSKPNSETAVNPSLSLRDKKARDRILKLVQMDDLPLSWIHLLDDMLRIGRRPIDKFETSRLYCSAEWHFAHFEGGTYAPMIYSLALRLGKDSDKFWPSIPELAKYLNANEKSIREAIQLLVLSGFLKIVTAAPGESVRYLPVKHEDWAEAHPGFCMNKDEMPWSGGGDELGKALYAISGGINKGYSNFLKSYRATGHSDPAIKEHFRTFWPKHNPKEKRIGKFFLEYLRGQAVISGTEFR